MMVQTQAIRMDLVNLKELFFKVETSLSELENITAEIEQRKQKRKLILELSNYSQTKSTELNQLKATLAAEHAKKVASYEEKNKNLKKEKEKVFEDKFFQELEQYKQLGHLERQPVVEHGQVMLEDILIDNDSTSQEEFHKFLEDNPGSEWLYVQGENESSGV